MKRSKGDSETKTETKLEQLVSPSFGETEVVGLESKPGKHVTAEESVKSGEICVSDAKKMKKLKKGSKKSSRKRRAEEFYVPDVDIASKKDLELERKLSKKLKVKEGRLRGMDDGMNVLLEGLSSAMDLFGEEEVPGASELPTKRSKKSSSSKKRKEEKLSNEGMEAETISGVSMPVETSVQDGASEEVPDGGPVKKKHKKRKLLGQQQEDNVVDDATPVESRETEVASEDAPAEVPVKKVKEKYIAPHLRARAGNEPEEHTQIRRRVRGKEARIWFDFTFLTLYHGLFSF